MTNKTPAQWRQELPLIGQMMDLEEALWFNPGLRAGPAALADCPLTAADVADASARLRRFAPYLAAVFPDAAPTGGIIESPLVPIPAMQARLGDLPGRLLLKEDSHLPISGSIKARGGIYEILHLAEDIAVGEGMLSLTDNYAVLA